jgi:hypothetical protein
MVHQKKDSRKQQGGRKSRRHGSQTSHQTRKGQRSGTWPQFVKKTYEQMKKTNKKTTFGEAMKEASRRKKRGEF